MSKSKSTNKSENLDAKSKGGLWDVAITDAEQMIENLSGQIRQLKQSILAFKGLREAGAPFPGSAEAARLLGQDNDL